MKRLFEKIKNNKSFILPWIVLGISIIIFASGLTYAYFDYVINSEDESSLRTVATDLVITIGGTTVDVNNLYPIYDDYKDTEAYSFPFTVANESRKMSACYSVKLNIESISESLRTADFKWELINNTTGSTTNGNFLNEDDNEIIFSSNQTIVKDTSVSYTLKVWLSNSTTVNQSNTKNASMSSKIVVKSVGNACFSEVVTNYSYTGSYQTFTAPSSGMYQIEAWGASGGDESSVYTGGLGGFTFGKIYLNQGETIYIYVGGSAASGGYNGGSSNTTYTGGGGASDVRYFGSTTPNASTLLWNNSTGLNSRIMVAAGGGGASGLSAGTDGGLLFGSSGVVFASSAYTLSTGGTQISGGTGATTANYTGGAGTFGIGGILSGNNAGGGAGYYGGGGGISADQDEQVTISGASGSSYISGYAGVNSIKEGDIRNPRVHLNTTNHYSGKYFLDGKMESGANSGNGRVKITSLGKKFLDRINTSLNSVRYIKDCLNGSTLNAYYRWVELQAIYNGENIAKGKIATGIANNSTYPLSRITDGDITSTNYAGVLIGNACITIDLGSEYNLDEIAVWHYWADSRTYYNNVTSVSSDGSTWTTVMNETIPESGEGKRVNAYEDPLNGYIQNGLAVWYDGINNTSTTHSTNTATWRDLSGSNYNGTVNGASWGNNYLSFDGLNDWVSIRELNYANPTVEVVYEISGNGAASTQYLVSNHETGGYGLYTNQTGTILYTLTYISENSAYSNITTSVVKNIKYSISTTYDGSYLKLYKAGSMWDFKNVVGSIVNPTSSTIVALGTNPSGSVAAGSYLKGKIYSVRIYNRALTSHEVEHNYKIDKVRFGLD